MSLTMNQLKEGASKYATHVYEGAILAGLTEREAEEAANSAFEEYITDYEGIE